MFAALVNRKFNRVTCIPLILAENPVHLVAEVVQRVASQMDDAIPTTWTTLWYRKKCSTLCLVHNLKKWYVFWEGGANRALFFSSTFLPSLAISSKLS